MSCPVLVIHGDEDAIDADPGVQNRRRALRRPPASQDADAALRLCHRNWLIFPVSVTQTLIVVERLGDLTHLTRT